MSFFFLNIVNNSLILIDIGNTLIKSFEFNGNIFLNKIKWENINFLKQYLINKTKVFICSVIHSKNELIKIFNSNIFFYFDHNTKLPINIEKYEINKLGLDRIALIVGANYFYPKKLNLVIDLGTCITYDLINSENIYLGGAISTGISLRVNSINNLRNINFDLNDFRKNKQVFFPASNTKNCIYLGIINSIVFEIIGFINLVKEKYKKVNVIITGGDSYFFKNKINDSVNFNSDLLMIGLKEIYNFNGYKI